MSVSKATNIDVNQSHTYVLDICDIYDVTHTYVLDVRAIEKGIKLMDRGIELNPRVLD